uniref:Uncharacterized protein n=1 Tax=Phytophthora ramorum TaxID=164328 RepID=H3H127_PHYRM
MRSVRFQERADRVEYDALTTAELLGSQGGDEDESEIQTDRSEGTYREELQYASEDDEQSLLSQLSALQAAERLQSVRFEDELQSDDDSQEAQYPCAIAAGIDASLSSPRSPLLKKFAPIQDRRVNTILLEALHLTDISRDEIGLIERSVKRLNDAILGFALLVDKQVRIIGATSPEECGRVKAEIQDLSRQLKASNALIESTCARMKKHLVVGRNQISAHKRRLMTDQMSRNLFSSVLDAVGLHDKEFLDMRDMRTLLHGILAFFIARNPALKFLDKAYHRRLMPEYVNQLADSLVMDMQLIPQLSGRSVIVTPVQTLEEYMCTEPFRFDRLLLKVHVNASDNSMNDPSNDFFTPPPFADAAAEAAATTYPTSPFKEQMTRNGGIMNGGKAVELVVAKPRDPELIETAEQTLGMAKLLHELATAECEARNGNRISIRAQVPHSKEFSRAYIASSKELMLQETGLS